MRTYDAFGVIRSQTGSSTNDWLYTGQQRDDESGYDYLRARYYDPSLGRFLGQDPVSPDWKMPQTMNRFAYVLNNPLNLVDPTGLYWTGCDYQDGYNADGSENWVGCEWYEDVEKCDAFGCYTATQDCGTYGCFDVTSAQFFSTASANAFYGPPAPVASSRGGGLFNLVATGVGILDLIPITDVCPHAACAAVELGIDAAATTITHYQILNSNCSEAQKDYLMQMNANNFVAGAINIGIPGPLAVIGEASLYLSVSGTLSSC